MNLLGQTDVAFQNQLIRIGVRSQACIAGQCGFESVVDINGACMLQSKDLDDHVAVFRKHHHVDFGAEHHARLKLSDAFLIKVVDHDDLVVFHHPHAIEAEGLKEEIQGFVLGNGDIIHQGDLHRCDLSQSQHDGLARPLHDVLDDRFDLFVLEVQGDEFIIRASSFGLSIDRLEELCVIDVGGGFIRRNHCIFNWFGGGLLLGLRGLPFFRGISLRCHRFGCFFNLRGLRLRGGRGACRDVFGRILGAGQGK